MRVSVSASCRTQAQMSEASLERLLRIAFTRYAGSLRQITLVLGDRSCPGMKPGYHVRLVVCCNQWPDVEVEEMQPRLDLAVDRAIHRTDGMLRQFARQPTRRTPMKAR